MVFADKRFGMKKIIDKMPMWIQKRLYNSNIGIPCDAAL